MFLQNISCQGQFHLRQLAELAAAADQLGGEMLGVALLDKHRHYFEKDDAILSRLDSKKGLRHLLG